MQNSLRILEKNRKIINKITTCNSIKHIITYTTYITQYYNILLKQFEKFKTIEMYWKYYEIKKQRFKAFVNRAYWKDKKNNAWSLQDT